MPDILVLCPGREGRRVVEDQLGNLRAEIGYFNTRSELRIAAGVSGVRAVVSDLFDGDGRPMGPFLRDLNHEFPELKILLSYDPSPAALDDVLEVATCGARLAFAARPFNHLGHLLRPLLELRPLRSPSAAGNLVIRVTPHAESVFTRRCLTFASVNPAHRLTIRQVAQFCDTTERTLYRHLEPLGTAKLVLSALAWPQANYLLTALHWRARQVADYFGYHRPGYLINLLADYVESGLWRLGLDEAVDGVAALTAEAAWRGGIHLQRRRFRPRMELALLSATGQVIVADEMPWTLRRRIELGQRILGLLGNGASSIEIVRRLWRHYDISAGQLYRSVMHIVRTAYFGGFIEDM